MADIARLLREQRASLEVEDILKRSTLTREEAIRQSAETFGVEERAVAILRKQMDVPPTATRTRPSTPGELATVERLKEKQFGIPPTPVAEVTPAERVLALEVAKRELPFSERALAL